MLNGGIQAALVLLLFSCFFGRSTALPCWYEKGSFVLSSNAEVEDVTTPSKGSLVNAGCYLDT